LENRCRTTDVLQQVFAEDQVMNVSLRLLCLVIAVAACIGVDRNALGQQSADASAPPQSQLRWTPHRISQGQPTPPASTQTGPAAAATASAPAKADQQASQPPASVALPPGVPPVNGPTVPGYDPSNPTNNTTPGIGTRFARAFRLGDAQTAAVQPPRPAAAQQPQGAAADYAPLRGSMGTSLGEWTSPNRIAGSFRVPRDPANPDSRLGFDMTRAPQGERGRPLLAAEIPPRRPMPQQPPLVGGGEAPRFGTNVPGNGRPRGDRLAMNVDGMPSVMSRGPEAATIDGGGTGRMRNVSQSPATPSRPAAPPASQFAAPPSATLPQPSTPKTVGPAGVQPEPSITIDTIPSNAMPIESMPMESMSVDSMPMGSMPIEMGGMPSGPYDDQMQGMEMMPSEQGMWMGQYPSQVHVESFYDDPYAYEDCEDYGCLDLCEHDGRFCAWMRQFGRPYYGWRWYRDFTASAGVTSFTNGVDLGINGNFGFNEYLNWAMPFWNAFGIGWQLGVRGVQTDYQSTTINVAGTEFTKPARDQVFVTTGFFTRAFEGRGLQGGAVYDYLSDQYYDTVDVAQIRSELSYVFGYHEFGYWGAQNILNQNSFLLPRQTNPITGTSVDFYSAFYRLHFGDANEWRFWGGATSTGDGIIGSSIRAPMSRSFGIEGAFTYLIPKEQTTVTIGGLGSSASFNPAAWNLSVNFVYYPAGRSRRGLASPYRPLFDVADNGSLIRSSAP